MTDLDQRPAPYYTEGDELDENEQDYDLVDDPEDEIPAAEAAASAASAANEEADTLAHLQREAASLAAYNQQSSDALLEMGESLRTVYDQAAANQDEPTMALVTKAYERGGQLVEQTAKLQAAHAAALTLAAKIQQRATAIATELANLSEAVQSADTDHPLVNNLVEWVGEEAFNDAEDYVGDVLFDSLIEEFAGTFDMNHMEAAGLIDRIREGTVHDAFIHAAQIEMKKDPATEDDV